MRTAAARSPSDPDHFIGEEDCGILIRSKGKAVVDTEGCSRFLIRGQAHSPHPGPLVRA